MKCPQCKESLDMLRGNLNVKLCPFCGASLDVEDFLETAIEKLVYLVEQNGPSIFSAQNRESLLQKMEAWPASLSRDCDVFKLLAIKKIPEAIFNMQGLSVECAKGIFQECLTSLTQDFYIPTDKAIAMMQIVAKPLKINLDDFVLNEAGYKIPCKQNDSTTEKKLACPKCGFDLKSDWLACPSCGFEL